MDGLFDYKCGEIFITYQGKYSYNCIICRELFDSIEYYQDHYMVQHFESKELYGEDGQSFRIKIEPITEHDLEFIKSEVNSEEEDAADFEDIDLHQRINCSIDGGSDGEQTTESDEDNNEIVHVTIEEQSEQHTDNTEHETIEWNESEQEINVEDFNEFQEEINSNIENLNENSLPAQQIDDISDDFVICELCSTKCQSSDYLKHVFEHEEDGICPLCNKNVNSLKKHSIIYHKSQRKTKLGNNPTQGFDSNQLRKRPEKRKSISCKYCYKIFYLVSALEQHEELHEKQLLNCKYCNKSYSDLRFLRYHMRKHTGERPFKCEQCHAAFTTKDNLNTHIIYKHTDSFNFVCTYDGCNKKFKTKELRKRHINNIHLKVFGYQCDVCGQKFMTSSRLCIHRVKNHVEPEAWPYKCEFCDKSFILQCKLREHINYHTGEKPFKCDLCDQQFMKKRTLNDHKKKHK